MVTHIGMKLSTPTYYITLMTLKQIPWQPPPTDSLRQVVFKVTSSLSNLPTIVNMEMKLLKLANHANSLPKLANHAMHGLFLRERAQSFRKIKIIRNALGYMSVLYHNNGIDMVNLPRILNNKYIKDAVPSIVQNVTPPIKYRKSIGGKIFNQNK